MLFRYALAILSYMEEKLIKMTDYMSIFNTFRTEVTHTKKEEHKYKKKKRIKVSYLRFFFKLVMKFMLDRSLSWVKFFFLPEPFALQVESLVDVKRLTTIAFVEVNPFPQRIINSKREHHHKILKVQAVH